MKFLVKPYSFDDFIFESDVVNKIFPCDWQKPHFSTKVSALNKNIERVVSHIFIILFPRLLFRECF